MTAGPGPSPSTETETVLSKTHRLLSVFSDTVDTVGLSELSRRSGISKASTFRLAEQLVRWELLVKTPRGYQLGWWLYELGQFVPGPARLRMVARPAMVDVRAAIRALVVHLAIPHGDDVVYLDRIGGRRESIVLTAIGASAATDQTVSGQVLQAYRFEENDSSLAAEARAELMKIRQRRWASEHGEVVKGTKTFAVPVQEPHGARVIAAISATVRAERHDDQAVLHHLWAAAVEISRALERQPVR